MQNNGSLLRRNRHKFAFPAAFVPFHANQIPTVCIVSLPLYTILPNGKLILTYRVTAGRRLKCKLLHIGIPFFFFFLVSNLVTSFLRLKRLNQFFSIFRPGQKWVSPCRQQLWAWCCMRQCITALAQRIQWAGEER